MSRLTFCTAAALATAWSAAHVPSARAAIITFTDRAAFNAVTSTSTITFQGLAPVNSFQFFNSPPGLTVSGVNFQATAGSNNLFVIDPGFSPPDFAFPSGQFLQNNSFAANTGIVVNVPLGTTAFGADISSQIPAASTVTVTFSTGELFVFTLPGRPTLSFRGFISDTPFTSVTIRSSLGGLTLDNVSVGQAVPEPASLALAGVGGLAVVGARRLRRRPGA